MPTSIEDFEYIVISYFFIDIDALKRWAKEFFSDEKYMGRYLLDEGPLDLRSVRLGNPYSGASQAVNALVFSPQSNPEHSVFVSNSGDGWYTLVNCICRDLGIQCIHISSTRDGAEFPSNSFRVYEKGQDIRYVRAMLDGDRWDFFEKGTVQACERVENYKKKRIRDRLDRKIIIDYLKRLDIDIQARSFWESDSPAFYIRQKIHN